MNVGKYLRGEDRHVGTARVINKSDELTDTKPEKNTKPKALHYGELRKISAAIAKAEGESK